MNSFIRFRSLGEDFTEENLKKVIAGEKESPERNEKVPDRKEAKPEKRKFDLVVDIQEKMAQGKNGGYVRWAKKYNVKQFAESILFLQQHDIHDKETLDALVDGSSAKYHELMKTIKDAEEKMYSKVESILKQAAAENQILVNLEFEAIEEKKKQQIIKKVATECKKCVVGALYDDFDGVIYSFDLKESGLILNYCIYDFMLRHKSELEKLNYYSWARFLEQVNDDNALIRVINKLELATPKREDLSVYREILRREFEEDTCFYCGKKLQKVIHVDHFIPWSFVKDDKIWNFVLSCPTCNEKKNNRVPGKDYLIRIEDRNKKIQLLNNTVIQTDFAGYSDDLIGRMWSYAKLSGIKEYRG